MVRNWEVRTGRHVVGHMSATTAHEAVGEYLRGIGCHRDEIRRMGSDTACWRGAVYRAVPAGDDRRRAA
jgi:hypothetical protein